MKMLKTMFAVLIAAGLAAISAKAQCSGPILVPGYTAGSCLCSNYDDTSGTGTCNPSSQTIGHRDDYYTCGDGDYTSCTTSYSVVGYVNPGCVGADKNNCSGFSSCQAFCLSLYLDCLAQNNGYNNGPCYYKYCDFTQCSMATSGGTPIYAQVYVSVGDHCGG